jgi:uncharacterized protein YjiS (DUF1127 family)
MLTAIFRQPRNTIGEWHRRARSRRELAMLGEVERCDPSYRFDVSAEMHKAFWQH